MPAHIRTATRPIALLLLLAVGLAVAGEASSRSAALPTLYVSYASKCTFTITTDSGAAATAIAPGTYQVQVTTPGSFGGVDLTGVSDMTACKGSAQFQLTGPGVNITTTLNDGDASQDVLTATFQPNSTYVAVDNNQPSVARVSFTTLASGAGSTSGGSTTGTTTTGTTTTKGTTPSTTIKGTLKGTVTAAGKVTLTYKGKAVLELPAGLYKFSVVDKSKKSGFFVKAQKGAAVTVSGIASVGTKTATINLKTGQWFFYPTTKAAKTGFIVLGGGLEG